MSVKALPLLLALLLPVQAWPQGALDQAAALADGAEPADRVYDGASDRAFTSGVDVVDGSGSAPKPLPPMSAAPAKSREIVVPGPEGPPKPQPGDPRAKRGAVKGGIIGGIFGAIAGLVTGWGIGGIIGGALAVGLSMGIGALVFGAAAAAIGADVGRHCAVDPECG